MKRYRGRAPLLSRAHDRQAEAGRRHTPAPGRLKRKKGLIIFSENTPQKEFQNSQLCSCWRNRSNKSLFRLYTSFASPEQNHDRPPSSNSNFPPTTFPAAADGDAAARCTCPAYLLRVGAFPVLLFSSSCSKIFVSLQLNLFCPVTGYPS